MGKRRILRINRFKDCVVSVRRTINNVFIVIRNRNGMILKSFSSGKLGFKNAKKDTPYAFEQVGKAALGEIVKRKVDSVTLELKSPMSSAINSVLKGFFKTQQSKKDVGNSISKVQPKTSDFFNKSEKKKIFAGFKSERPFNNFFKVRLISRTSPAHNGCRPKRLRRT
jgi:ribosomal protein S11